jgi:hypothetical protein
MAVVLVGSSDTNFSERTDGMSAKNLVEVLVVLTVNQMGHSMAAL